MLMKGVSGGLRLQINILIYLFFLINQIYSVMTIQFNVRPFQIFTNVTLDFWAVAKSVTEWMIATVFCFAETLKKTSKTTTKT